VKFSSFYGDFPSSIAHLPEAHGRISLPSRCVCGAHGHRAEAAAGGIPHPEIPWWMDGS